MLAFYVLPSIFSIMMLVGPGLLVLLGGLVVFSGKNKLDLLSFVF